MAYKKGYYEYKNGIYPQRLWYILERIYPN